MDIKPEELMAVGFQEGNIVAQLPNGLNFGEAMKLLGTLSLYVLNTYAKDRPHNIKEEMYQAFNYQTSNLLAAFLPDKELRPDLTAEAIMKAEDELVEARYNKLNREARRKGKQAFQRTKKKLAKTLSDEA